MHLRHLPRGACDLEEEIANPSTCDLEDERKSKCERIKHFGSGGRYCRKKSLGTWRAELIFTSDLGPGGRNLEGEIT